VKPASADGQNESTEKPWPSVLEIASSDEFQQSFAVAQLAVKLCEMEKVAPAALMLNPDEYLGKAWELIKKAREHVARSQTGAEYLAAHGGSDEAAETVVGRMLQNSRVPFEKLYNPKRNKGDSETVHGVIWKVFTTERGFDDLFWAYWTDIGEQWRQWMKGEKPRTPWMKRDAVTFWKLASNKEKYSGGFEQLWKERGQSMLDSWKRDGVPANDFLALAKFRREHDKRAANLKPKQKRKNRRTTVKSRVGARKHRTR
jgi:hypothetical protein